jgi:hypothetical protein
VSASCPQCHASFDKRLSAVPCLHQYHDFDAASPPSALTIAGRLRCSHHRPDGITEASILALRLWRTRVRAGLAPVEAQRMRAGGRS